MFSEEEIIGFYSAPHPKEISDGVHMKNVDMLLELRRDVQRKIESADVTKTCLSILRAIAYLSVAFSNERIAANVLSTLGFPLEQYDAKLDSVAFFKNYFDSLFRIIPDRADFNAKDFIGYDVGNTFVGLLSNLYMACFSEYSNSENIGLYNQSATQIYFNNLIKAEKDNFSFVAEDLLLLLGNLHSQIFPYRKAIEMVTANAQIGPGTKYLLEGETGYEDALSLEVSRGMPKELCEHLLKEYKKFLKEAHTARFVGNDLTVTEAAKVLNSSGARIYQLLDEGKLEAIPKSDERNTRNKMLVSLQSINDYLDELIRQGKADAWYLFERLMPFGHLEVEFSY